MNLKHDIVINVKLSLVSYTFDNFLPVKLLKLLPPGDLILYLGQVSFVQESLPGWQAMIPALVDKASSFTRKIQRLKSQFLIHYICNAHFYWLWRRKFAAWKS